MPTEQNRRARGERLARQAFLAGFVAMVANATAIGIFVWQSADAREELAVKQQEQCQALRDVAHTIAHALISATDQPDRTPEEQAIYDEAVAEFSRSIDEGLPTCRKEQEP